MRQNEVSTCMDGLGKSKVVLSVTRLGDFFTIQTTFSSPRGIILEKGSSKLSKISLLFATWVTLTKIWDIFGYTSRSYW